VQQPCTAQSVCMGVLDPYPQKLSAGRIPAIPLSTMARPDPSQSGPMMAPIQVCSI
jgi:hypothetical protein